MNVNKKNLAEMFNVDPRTIERWQTQGLPQISGGGKGIEIIFDSAKAIEWYAQREADIENEKLRKEVEDLRAASETDLQPGTIDYERYRLTKAQADAQELKNARDSGQVIDTGFCMYALARLAQDISGILDSIPLYMQRQFPEFPPSALEFLKSEIAK
ncbi:terminase small subunit, partial [Escherichia coli]|nr:terminase small subunit [Escherichia coli]